MTKKRLRGGLEDKMLRAPEDKAAPLWPPQVKREPQRRPKPKRSGKAQGPLPPA